MIHVVASCYSGEIYFISLKVAFLLTGGAIFDNKASCIVDLSKQNLRCKFHQNQCISKKNMQVLICQHWHKLKYISIKCLAWSFKISADVFPLYNKIWSFFHISIRWRIMIFVITSWNTACVRWRHLRLSESCPHHSSNEANTFLHNSYEHWHNVLVE